MCRNSSGQHETTMIEKNDWKDHIRSPGCMSRMSPSCWVNLSFQVFVLLAASSSFFITSCWGIQRKEFTTKMWLHYTILPLGGSLHRLIKHYPAACILLTSYCSSAPCLSDSSCCNCSMAACSALSFANLSRSSSCFSACVWEMVCCWYRCICSSSARLVTSSSNSLQHTDEHLSLSFFFFSYLALNKVKREK